jgi:acyl-CoA thioester hydrolase
MGRWHEARLRVRFEETDAMGVVYYAKFFAWFEVGRVGLFRELGMPLRAWAERGHHIPVVQAHADYKASARFDDDVVIRTRVARVGNSSVRFENEVYKLPEKTLLCTGHTVHAFIDGSGRASPFPDDVRAKLTSS